MTLPYIMSNLALLSFAAASVCYLVAFQKSARATWLGRLSFALFVLATIGVSVSLAAVARDASLSEMSGLLLTSAVGWLAIVAHLRFNMRLIGAFVAPLATLILLMKSFISPTGIDTPALQDVSLLMKVHVAFAVLGQAFAILACAVSVLYLWQQNLLKKKMLDQLPANVPAIDKLGGLLGKSLWSGFVFLTLGLLSGALYTQLNGAMQQLHLEFKVIWAICVWIWYLATLLAKNIFDRPSKRIAQMSLAGFLLLAISYFGMGFLRPMGGG